MADLKDVKAKQLQQAPLWSRMDNDRRLAYLEPYKLVDKVGEAVDGIVNVTLNLPATFNAHVQSSLMAATQQGKVTGDDMDDEQTTPIENFLKAALAEADRLLRLKGEPPMRPFVTEQLDLRGRAAVRVTFRKEKNALVADLLPLDTRWLTYEFGPDGLEWAAYTTQRTPEMVKLEYPDWPVPREMSTVEQTAASKTQLVEVVDLWDKKSNKIYINTDKGVPTAEVQPFKQQEHSYGRVPIAIKEVPLGSMFKEPDAIARYGESIFFLIRDLIPELNRLVSIMQTFNQFSVKGAREWMSKEGTQAAVPEGLDIMDTITAADIGGGSKLVDQGDIKSAGRLMFQLLSRFIQAASLSLTDFGNLDFPLSAVALIELSESSNQVFLPRLGAKGLLFQEVSEMIVEQTRATGLQTVKFGTKGHMQTFRVKDLDGAYDIEYLYIIKSPQTDIARMNIADVARPYFSRHDILENILMDPDPTTTMQRKRIDEAEDLSPNIKLYRLALAEIAEGRNLEAQIISEELGFTLEQVMSGEIEPPSANEQQPQPARNLLNPPVGTAAGSGKRATDLMGKVGEGTGGAEE